ncbi:DUF2294 domain-containing protein [Geomicrobium sediminis]|uniref:Uncharacterized protein YbcI n=1 Tax=Geomicrobium sediminis TaxID=1347788 RepID=A0ABS2PEH6_9BACL|nr:DUF2294 domain-containing protein [Geomicrobium sediminis]MBM7633223.1 uncharacterized protein YbcI [Geomicrobium sediminis]
MKSIKRQLESELSEAFIKFQRELIGRGPQEARIYIVKDMVIARFKGVLTVEEKHLINHSVGVNLVKQMRMLLRDMYIEDLKAIVEQKTGCEVLTSHSDLSTETGERMEIFVINKNLEKELLE